MFLNRPTRLTAAIAAAVLAIAGHAFAGDTDTATVRIIANGLEDSVEVALHELAVGESRQLTAASGSPAIVTRSEDGLSIELAGKRTEVRFPGRAADLKWVDGSAGEKQVRVVRIDHDGEAGDDTVSAHKVIVLTRGSGDGDLEVLSEDLRGADGAISAERIAELVSQIEGEAGNGEQVIVTRRVVSESESQD